MDTSELRERGYTVLRGLIPAAAVHEVTADVTAVYARHGWLAGPDRLVPDVPRREGVPGWWRFAEDVQRLESFHRLAHHPALRAVAARAAGGRVLHHPRRHLTPVNPGFWVPPHQEYTHIQGSPDFFTAFVPLTPFRDAALRVLRESGPRRVRRLTVLPTRGVRVDVGDGEWDEVTADPGDVVIMHALTTREVTENTGAEILLAAQYRFQSRSLPVVKASLKPEHYPRLPDWGEITKGWSSRKWVVPPLFPKLVPYVMPPELESWHELLDPPQSVMANR